MILCALALAAGQAEFDAGNTAYAAGDLAGAEAAYRQALVAGGVDEDVYFNLGNVLYRQEKVPLAVLAWRRGLALAPRDPDIEANLDFARRGLIDHVDPVEPTPWFAPWQAALTPGEGQWLGAALAGLGLLAIGLRRRLPAAPLVGGGIVATVVGLVIGGAALADAAMPPAAVVLVKEVTARSDLGGGVDLFTLHAGAEVVTADRAAGHLLIALPDGRKGWVDEADVGLVEPGAPL